MSDSGFKSRYTKLDKTRRPFLERARRAAEFTLPMLLPREGMNEAQHFHTPYQSLGSRGVNNLASKLLLSLFPPNEPFFRLTVDDFQLEELKDKDARGEIEVALNKIERAVANEVETRAFRVPIFEGLKHLIVSGNILLHMQSDGMRVFPLSKFVCSRDARGNVLEIIVHEKVSPLTLAKDVIETCGVEVQGHDTKDVDIYTGIHRNGDKWEIRQEINNITVPDSEGQYPLDKTPWLPLRMITVDGEDYGRGYVEEYIGDLISLEGLSKAIVQGAAAAAKLLILVRPNGTTDMADVANAENGAVREGDPNDVAVVQMEKSADFRVAMETSRGIEERLSFAFLLNTAIQRNAERVTAEEIRYMAGELEDALGGIYSILSQTLQLPMVNLLMHKMESEKRLPVLPKDLVRPAVVTGIEALGRGHDLNKLGAFIAQLQPLGEAAFGRIDMGELLERLAASNGIDPDGLIIDQEAIEAQQQEQQQQGQMQALMEKLGPEAIRQGGQMMQNQQQEGAENG